MVTRSNLALACAALSLSAACATQRIDFTTHYGIGVITNGYNPDREQIDDLTRRVIEYLKIHKDYPEASTGTSFFGMLVEFRTKEFNCKTKIPEDHPQKGRDCFSAYDPTVHKITIKYTSRCLSVTDLAHEMGHAARFYHEHGWSTLDWEQEKIALDVEHEDLAVWEAVKDARWQSCLKYCSICKEQTQMEDPINGD